MREIKFRAWLKKDEQMVDVDIISWVKEDQFVGHSPVSRFIETISGHSRYEDEGATDLKDVELMMFTGLLDKNSKKIYQGDLFIDEEDGTYNWVEWNDVYGGWGTNQWFLPKELVEQAPTLEIVGNIYEDSHLLNSSEGDII